jgi:hypothetical protein
MVGYTIDQLADYVFRQLGTPIWDVELTRQHVLDNINDSLAKYSMYRPKMLFGAVRMSKGHTNYLQDTLKDWRVLAVVSVEFVDTVPAPTEIFYGNLISPAPIIRTGLDEYDTFLRWRKTWQRVTSVEAKWHYDEVGRVLRIYNPLDRYHCGITLYAVHDRTEELPLIGAIWVKEYSVAKARFTYGDILMKFSGVIPGPVQNMQLDQGKRDEAKKDIEKLDIQIVGMQETSPVQLD